MLDTHPDPLLVAEEVTRTVANVHAREVEALGRAIWEPSAFSSAAPDAAS